MTFSASAAARRERDFPASCGGFRSVFFLRWGRGNAHTSCLSQSLENYFVDFRIFINQDEPVRLSVIPKQNNKTNKTMQMYLASNIFSCFVFHSHECRIRCFWRCDNGAKFCLRSSRPLLPLKERLVLKVSIDCRMSWLNASCVSKHLLWPLKSFRTSPTFSPFCYSGPNMVTNGLGVVSASYNDLE